MRSNIPSFQLPATVIDEEIGLILDLGVELKLDSPVASMRELLEKQGFPKKNPINGKRAIAATYQAALPWGGGLEPPPAPRGMMNG